MKKRLILMMVCCATMATAQTGKGMFSIKPMAGINVSTFSGGIVSDMYHTKVGFTAGMEAEYGLNNFLGLSLGIVYSQQGAKVDGALSALFTDISTGKSGIIITSNKGKIHCDYLNLPLLANFHIPALRGLTLKTGLQMGILVKSQMNLSTDAAIFYDYGNDSEPHYWNVQEVSNTDAPTYTHYESNMSDICKSIDVGIPIGLSYEYKNVVLDVRYCFGLTKIDNTQEPEDTRNRTLSVTLGYNFKL